MHLTANPKQVIRITQVLSNMLEMGIHINPRSITSYKIHELATVGFYREK